MILGYCNVVDDDLMLGFMSLIRSVFLFLGKIQAKIVAREAKREEIDVCGRFIEQKSMGINGVFSSICCSSW